MKVKTHVKAGQIGVGVNLIGQQTGMGANNNQGGAIGLLNAVTNT